MSRNSKVSDVLHVLPHMRDAEQPMTSEAIGRMLQANAVVVLRLMAGLRNAGYVSSEKGHGGGWTVVCDLQTTTLDDVYRAMGSPPLVSIGHRSSNPQCLVEKAIQVAMNQELRSSSIAGYEISEGHSGNALNKLH